MTIQRVAMTMLVVFLTFYLLFVGRSLLLPLVVSAAVAYLINILAHAICRIRVRGVGLPRVVAMILAIAVILVSMSFVVHLITLNIASVITIAPKYQKELEAWIYRGYEIVGMEEAPTIQEMLNRVDFRTYLQTFAGTVRTLVSSTGIIIVYLVFLLLEQRTFPAKIRALVPDPERQKELFELIGRIRGDIRTYIGIKVLTSAATALLSYFVLSLVGVDFASFWAILIFFLNFIPTIGAIVATAFPAMLALVQFDTLTPFIVTVLVLTTIQFGIGSLIEPKLLGSSLNLSPIVIVLSIGLWGSIWGIVGMFICVPITVVIMIVFSYFPETRPVAILLSGTGNLAMGPRRATDPPRVSAEEDDETTEHLKGASP